MKPRTTPIERLTWVLVSSAWGLVLVVGLFLLARLPVRARPVAAPTGTGLTVDKYANTDFAYTGDTLTYTVSISAGNSGATASVWLTDELPTQLTYVADSLTAVDSLGNVTGTFGTSNGVITWHEPSLAGPVCITFSAQISSETEVDIVNVAEVTGTGELITDSWETRVGGGLVYMPLIARRWPPIPYAPVLHEISNPDQQRDYTVNWDYDYTEPPVFSYTLQEAENEGFTQDVTGFQITVPSSSKGFANKDGGTYYYRVRGHNEYGPGPWSNVVRTTVFSYFDDFSDPKSGWPSLVDDARWAFYEVDPDPPTPGDGSPYPSSGDGYFIARRCSSPPLATFSPGVAVPSKDYEIEVDTRWWEGRWGATYQILFSADESLSNYYAVRVKMDWADEANFCRFSVVKHTPEATKFLTDWWDIPQALYCGERRLSPGTPWNHWRIRRNDDWIKVYVNGDFLGQWKDSTFGAYRYFGVRATLYEGFTPSKPEFDNFSVRLID